MQRTARCNALIRHTGTNYIANTQNNHMKLQCADEDNETTTLLMEMQPRTSTDDYIDEIRTSAATDISHLADHSQGTTRFGQTQTADDIDDIVVQRYDDFHTIDWQRDLARDRLRHKRVVQRAGHSSPVMGFLASIFDASSGWLCVLIVGLCAGAIAGLIDIGTKWMSNLKDGVCANRFWLDKEHCCWAANLTDDEAFAHQGCDQWYSWPRLVGLEEGPSYMAVEFFFYVSLSVGMATLCVTLVKVFAPYACGSGIPEIKCILSGFIIRGYLGKWTFIIKSVGLMLAAASGLNLGKEGPMVHLACCIGNIFSYAFPKYGKNEAKKREILSASAAAGVSVAFGAPIGGVLFSLEEASYYFPLKTLWRSFFCALIAGVTLKSMSAYGTSQTSLFYVDYEMKWTFFELIPFTVLGIFGGLIGAIFIYANIKWSRYRKITRSLGHPILEVVIVTAITSAVGFWNPYTRQSSSDLIHELFDRCGVEDESDLCDYTDRTYLAVGGHYLVGEMGPGVRRAIVYLLLALISKLVLTVFTFGMKIPAGLFVPSLAMGATVGRIVGIFMENIAIEYSSKDTTSIFSHCKTGKECIMPGLYAMVGAAAVLGGVTLSLVVIMFELTGSLQFIVPTMVAVMWAKWVGDALGKMGIYDAHIVLNNYPFLDNKEEFTHNTRAAQVMRPREGEAPLRMLTQEGMTVGDVEQLLSDTDHNGFPVVVSNDTQYLVGFITRRDLKLALAEARRTQEGIVTQSPLYFSAKAPRAPEPGEPAPLRLRKLVDLAPTTITDQTPMETVIDMFRKLGLRQCLVTHDGRLLGIITKKDVLKHINDMEDGDALLRQA